jgi:hypothetical protein
MYIYSTSYTGGIGKRSVVICDTDGDRKKFRIDDFNPIGTLDSVASLLAVTLYQ